MFDEPRVFGLTWTLVHSMVTWTLVQDLWSLGPWARSGEELRRCPERGYQGRAGTPNPRDRKGSCQWLHTVQVGVRNPHSITQVDSATVLRLKWDTSTCCRKAHHLSAWALHTAKELRRLVVTLPFYFRGSHLPQDQMKSASLSFDTRRRAKHTLMHY